MKNDSMTALLNFVLAVMVILGVVFALLDIYKVHSLRTMQAQVQKEMQQAQFASMRAQQVLSDVMAYNATAKSAELAQIIQSAQTPAPAPAPASK